MRLRKLFTTKKIAVTVVLFALTAFLLALQHRRQTLSQNAWTEDDGSEHHMSLRESLEPKKGKEIPHTDIKWADLLLLDYKTGNVPPELKKLEETTVKLPGYIVPLTDSYEPFDEFLIVPDPMACIHAPPPPPNQMLWVKTKKPLPIALSFYPLYFFGKLQITPTDSKYGSVGYGLKLQKLEIYEPDKEAVEVGE